MTRFLSPNGPSAPPPQPVSDEARSISVYCTPRLPGSGPDEIKVRLLRRSDGALMVHITSPDPVVTDRVMKSLFGAGQDYTVEMCG